MFYLSLHEVKFSGACVQHGVEIGKTGKFASKNISNVFLKMSIKNRVYQDVSEQCYELTYQTESC